MEDKQPQPDLEKPISQALLEDSEAKSEDYTEAQKQRLLEYKDTNEYKNVKNKAKVDLEKRKMIERFQAYSKYESKRHLIDFTEGSGTNASKRFWKTMTNSML